LEQEGVVFDAEGRIINPVEPPTVEFEEGFARHAVAVAEGSGALDGGTILFKRR
jgi:hypothetical protein